MTTRDVKHGGRQYPNPPQIRLMNILVLRCYCVDCYNSGAVTPYEEITGNVQA
jgi:hypothetical protein